MTLFSSLTRRSNTTSSDEKDHNSDNDDNSEIVQLTPLLLDSPTTSNNNNNNSTNSDSFTLRIKLNNGSSTIDYTLDSISQLVNVSKLKEAILIKHFTSTSSTSTSTTNTNNRYLRLIIRGRMMAPDTSTLDKFNIVTNDVIHAVLAKENVKGGQQARMLRRMNGITSPSSGVSSNSNNVAPNSNTTLNARQSLWRRIGIDSNGVVLSRSSDNNNELDDSDEFESEDSDFEDAHGEIDLEANQQPSQRRGRRRRERRGFDRLRAVSLMCFYCCYRDFVWG